MTSPESSQGVWRISVRGAVTPRTSLLLSDLQIAVVEATTMLETGIVPADACAGTIAELQSLGLEVVELHWVDTARAR